MQDEETETAIEPEATIEEVVEPTDEGSNPPKETEEQPKHEGSKGFQKRINKITADKYREQSRAEAAEAKLAELEKAIPVKEAPTLEQFDYDENEYQDARIDHRVAAATDQIRQEVFRAQAEDAQKRAQDDFARRVAATGIEDYGETIQTLVESVPLPSEVIDAIQGDDKGPELAYYLGKHLDVADKLAGTRNPLYELGKISAGLNTKRTTQAPNPVKTAGSGGSSTKDMESMTMDEIYAS